MNVIQTRLAVASRWWQSEKLLALMLLAGAVFIGCATGLFGAILAAKPIILAVALALMLGVLALFASVEWAFLALMLVRAGADPLLETTKLGSGGVGAGAILNLAFIFMAAMLCLRHPRAVKLREFSIWAPFLAVLLLGVARSPQVATSFKMWLTWLTVFGVYWTSVFLVRRGWTRDRLLKIVWCSSLLPVAVGILFAVLRKSPFDSGDVTDGVGFRLAGAFSHPNIHALYLLLTISLTLYFWKRAASTEGASRWMWPAYLLVLLALLLLTKTRSAWLAGAVILLFYGYFMNRRLLLAILIVAPALVLAVPELRDRLLDLGHGNTYVTFAKLNSFAWRKLLWSSALKDMHAAEFLWGRGALAFDADSVRFFPLSGGVEWGAHNVYMQLLFDLGAVGVIVYLALFLSPLRVVRHLWANDRVLLVPLLAAIFSALLVGYSDNMLRYLVFNLYMWMIVAVIVTDVSKGQIRRE